LNSCTAAGFSKRTKFHGIVIITTTVIFATTKFPDNRLRIPGSVFMKNEMKFSAAVRRLEFVSNRMPI
jgi:hypothetical protein